MTVDVTGNDHRIYDPSYGEAFWGSGQNKTLDEAKKKWENGSILKFGWKHKKDGQADVDHQEPNDTGVQEVTFNNL